MEKYDPATPCPACGYADEQAKTVCRRSDASVVRTVIVRECTRCGYNWFEQPLFINQASST